MVKFTKSKRLTKENIKDIPESKAVIYKLLNNNGKNIYTGIAGRGNAQERLLQHKQLGKDKIPGATKFRIAQKKTKVIAHKEEKKIIKKEKPKFNIQDK